MSGTRAGTTSRSLVTAFGLLGTGAVVIAATSLVALPYAGSDRPPASVSIPASDTLAACPGPVELPEDAAGTDAEFSAGDADSQRLSVLSVPADDISAAAPLDVRALTEDGSGETLAQGETSEGDLFEADATDAFMLTGTVLGSTPAQVQGAQATLTEQGDLRGLAATLCTPPATQQWLVGGSTALGSTSQLVLGNPSGAPAEVTLRLFSPDGEVDTAGSEAILVAPGATRTVLLGGLAPEVEDLAVSVNSTGGLVSAAIVESALDGLRPAGVDIVEPSSEPADRVVVPGVSLADPAESESQDAVPELRIANASGEPVDVDLLARGSEGPADWATERTSVPAHGVTRVPLDGLAAGDYQLELSATGPITAGAKLLRSSEADEDAGRDQASTDFAWVAGQNALAGRHLLPLPADIPAVLTLGRSGDEQQSATVRLGRVDEQGRVAEWQDIDVPGGELRALPLAELFEDRAVRGVVIDAGSVEEVYAAAALSADDGRLLSALGIPPAPDGVGSRGVRVLG